MRHVKASEARKRWFQLLDDVIAGDEVVIERNGHRIVIRAEPYTPPDPSQIPDYSDVIKGSVDDADRWGWEWSEEDGLVPIDLLPQE